MKTWTTNKGSKITRVLSVRSNVYLLTVSGKHLLVDTSPERKWTSLRKNLQRLSVDHVECLVLTHTHFDHAGNTRNVSETFNAKVVVHHSEAEFIRGGINKFPRGSIPVTKFLIDHGSDRVVHRFNFPPCDPHVLIDSVFSLQEYGFNAFILPTPGHSPGSMSLVIDDEIAIVGDAMFGQVPWTIYPPFADDPALMVKSWSTLLGTSCRLFLPGHGKAISREKLMKHWQALDK